mgnify:CR=1 FL=1
MNFTVVTNTSNRVDSMGSESELDKTSAYENGDGDRLSFAQIAFAAAKDPEVEVEEVDGEGYRFNGELYTPVESSAE